jgi:selenide,water dikinase
MARIAATHALGDIWAMGAAPQAALAQVTLPRLSPEKAAQMLAEVMEAAAEVFAAAGADIIGGHSSVGAELTIGFTITGLAGRAITKAGAMPGDALILTKPLGVGIYSAAYKRGLLDAADYAEMVDTMTRLNRVGEALAMLDEVHALTDVTGFGLAGHGLELARGAGVSITVDTARLPLLSRAEALARAGAVTGASGRNWASFDGAVTLAPALDAVWRDLVSDPQTSGGLLVSVAAPAADATLARIRDAGFDRAAIIGTVGEGPAGMAFR